MCLIHLAQSLEHDRHSVDCSRKMTSPRTAAQTGKLCLFPRKSIRSYPTVIFIRDHHIGHIPKRTATACEFLHKRQAELPSSDVTAKYTEATGLDSK